MALSEIELSTLLSHCRSLIDAADQLDSVAAGREGSAVRALRVWTGPLADAFRTRMDEESTDLSSRARGLRAEADAWARVWADTVNRINQQRRADRVDEAKAERGFGERTFDIIHGDDSEDQVRNFEPVPVPTAESRYAATGGLEEF